ncbi:hypothetical protein FIU87_03485 [Bacillus sp. THAF10]|uniref:hypothetical protein n=1 Tax=Bacillus sp. THAF10 TaxID=2587848 RepID=UPI0012A8DEDF|nr:hypothetical protein [Bacillus sp. THAF10]QFT87705.1 hypothetical protein FIU87_03485 [Bacillus sp. THAF10]
MTILGLGAALIFGIVLLVIGILTKKNWLKLISLIPLGIALYHSVYLIFWWFSM